MGKATMWAHGIQLQSVDWLKRRTWIDPLHYLIELRSRAMPNLGHGYSEKFC